MKARIKNLALVMLISMIYLPLNGQQQFLITKSDRIMCEKKIIDSLKIHEVRTYQYNYIGGKKSNQRILVEHTKYNTKGLVIYDFTSIAPELSYIKAKKVLSSKTHRELILNDGGLSEFKAVTSDFEEVYMLASTYRRFRYNKDKLTEITETSIIDNDTVVTLFQFFDKSPSTITLQTAAKSAWIISTSADFYLNDHLNPTTDQPILQAYFANYNFNNKGQVTGITGMHSGNNFSKQVYWNQQGKVEKIVGLYGNSKKPISTYSFQYDSRGNEVFSDIEDLPGHLQIKKKYDSNNNIIEYERIQTDKNKNIPNLADARYLHCLYNYNNNLLKGCVRLDKNSDTLCVISYMYSCSNDFSAEVSEKIENKLKDWKQKGIYESTSEYNTRISEDNIKNQSEIYRQEALNEIGMGLYNILPINMEYDADSECFKLTFEELNPLYVFVPRTEAEKFKNNLGKYTIYPQFEEGKDGLILKSCTIKSVDNLPEYKSLIK